MAIFEKLSVKKTSCFKVAKSTVSSVFRRLCEPIAIYLISTYITLPTNKKEHRVKSVQIKKRTKVFYGSYLDTFHAVEVEKYVPLFHSKHGFPQYIRVVDGTHIWKKNYVRNSIDLWIELWVSVSPSLWLLLWSPSMSIFFSASLSPGIFQEVIFRGTYVTK